MTTLAALEAGVPIVAFLLMLAVGLDVTRADVAALAIRRRLIGVATVAQALVLPAVALVLAQQFAAGSRLADYLLLVAACPGGGMSNVYVYLARANTALSVTLTALSCLLAPISMPLVLAAYQLILGRDMGAPLPLPVLLGQLLIMAVIPVSIGAWIRDRWPAVERRHGRALRKASAVGVALIVGLGLVDGAGAFDASLLRGGMAAGLLVLAGVAGGWVIGRLAGAPPPDRFTLLAEFGVRNLAIAMVIAVTLLGRTDFVAFGAVALFVQAAVLMGAVRLRGSTPDYSPSHVASGR